MDVLEAIRGRRSVRAFKNKDVPSEILEKLIDAAHWAPSAGNVQPWTFVIIRKVETKRKLAEAALNQLFILDASVVLVVCAEENRSFQHYGKRGEKLYCIQDTAAAAQNVLLTAYSLGLGTCWVGAFNEEVVSEALNTPQWLRPLALIPIGYPDESPSPPDRIPIEQLVHFGKFKDK